MLSSHKLCPRLWSSCVAFIAPPAQPICLAARCFPTPAATILLPKPLLRHPPTMKSNCEDSLTVIRPHDAEASNSAGCSGKFSHLDIVPGNPGVRAQLPRKDPPVLLQSPL